MANELNPLEKKIVKSALVGIGIGGLITAIEIGYIIPQKPFWTGKEAAAMLLASTAPMFIGTLPMFYRVAKECYREIMENGIFPRVDY